MVLSKSDSSDIKSSSAEKGKSPKTLQASPSHSFKRAWTLNEDIMLVRLVVKNGPQNWDIISQSMNNRSGKQIRERWQNHLNPNQIKTKWHAVEDWILYLSRRIFQSRWTCITKAFFGRTDNDCKNHWNTYLKHRINDMAQVLTNFTSKFD